MTWGRVRIRRTEPGKGAKGYWCDGPRRGGRSLDANMNRDDWLAALEVAEGLGASILNVIGSYLLRDRLTEYLRHGLQTHKGIGVRQASNQFPTRWSAP